MKKRAKLTQEQLKAVLQGWKTLLLACRAWSSDGHFSDEHIYTQIEELIEDSEIEDSEVDEDLAAWMDKCHEAQVELAELKKKKTVTREWVNKWEEKIEDICNTGEPAYLEPMLKEIGVEIVEPETIH